MSTPTPPRLMDHHGVQKWTSCWYDDLHKHRRKRFGAAEEVSAREALSRYQMWLNTEWSGKEWIRNPESVPAVYLVSDLASDYMTYARRTFVKHGRQTSHVTEVHYAMADLVAAYGTKAAATLEAPQLAKLRDSLVYAERTVKRIGADDKLVEEVKQYRRGLRTVNGRITIIKDAFARAREWGKVPRETVLDLQVVKPLSRGRSEAIDPKPVRPISDDVIAATAAVCMPTLKAMIELQDLTGMRPGDVRIMRTCDIDMGGDVWIYSPSEWKTEHLDEGGKRRQIALGPKAKEIVRKFLGHNAQAYLFSPYQCELERRAEAHKKRLKDGTPIEQGNRPGSADRGLSRIREGKAYTKDAYRKAIGYACARAGVAAWHPNQLRHSYATRVRKEFGLEAASDGLGHSNLSTTQIYAEQSLKNAIEVARKIG